MTNFKLTSNLTPQGDQPQAIKKLTDGIRKGNRYQALLGVTGSGKTFTLAHVINNIGKPVLVMSHNKTLAAQLYSEFKELFPENAVEYFVSYYDYYQPEAYVPQTDTYIEKDASINDEIDKLRLSATSALMSRDDVIIVASVSCIYGLGSPEDYAALMVFLKKGEKVGRDDILKKLVDIHYSRNDVDFQRGRFRVRGGTIEIFPAYENQAIRLELSGDSIERLREIDPLTGRTISEIDKIAIYPAKHFVTTQDKVERAIVSIKAELKERLSELFKQNKLLEAQRLESRTNYDMEMLKELGYCNGIENYSRHLSERPAGSRPSCLIDYFPEDFLVIIDESHVTVPQIRGMYEGDRSRKNTLVEYGFRLPSALDNRPLKFDEFDTLAKQMVFASATPADYELSKASVVAEQIIRPTGIVDPEITVRPSIGEIEDLIREIENRAERGERVLVTTLTKRMSEDLASYLKDAGIRVKYIHSELNAIERVEILRDLRLNKFDCLVGINLLREGIDLPEVSLVAVLDADKEGFLRSQTSLIQVAGRAARNINGKVILYADNITDSMSRAILESQRRRVKQLAYNKEHKITPQTVKKAIKEGIESHARAKEMALEATGADENTNDILEVISELEHDMELAARNLNFERATVLRDQIVKLKGEYGVRP
ncbi:MAG: excinuclease ABC subunit UvrB [Candidatus Omnitrophica bacterium]|nr:excinuclease ABC subunit UvrB [Candidatus Omnitrophota bacterium]MBU4488772.1 excinuclease ABC subunit UvrB [Candidatus Omnitrophota bacterium]MCG2705869.1 excinuclease ABC subunit UvrB [Candidatus Omnitrophota bacterium]